MKFRISLVAAAAVLFLGATALSAADIELKCPLSGKPVDETKTVDFNGGKVAFCCGNCPKAFAKSPDKFAAKANLQLVQSKQLKQVACPLTGRPCADDKVVEVAGVEVGVCCGGCLKKANAAEGDKLIVLLFKDTKKGFEPAEK